MITLLVAAGALVGFLVAYHTYGRWIARRVYRLDNSAMVPSRELRDDVDFVPVFSLGYSVYGRPPNSLVMTIVTVTG